LKPNINSVEVHPQLSNNRHPVDGGCWFIEAGDQYSIGKLSKGKVCRLSRPLTDNYELWKTDCCIKCGQEISSLEEEGIKSNNSLL
jgi:hypothetical protein